MSTLVELFIAFVKIGFTSFGGMSMVPLILEEMRAHQWMSTEDLTNVIAIAEMTPGTAWNQLRNVCRRENRRCDWRNCGCSRSADAGIYIDTFNGSLFRTIQKQYNLYTDPSGVETNLYCVDFNDDSGASGGKLCCGEQAGSASLWNRNTDDLSD